MNYKSDFEIPEEYLQHRKEIISCGIYCPSKEAIDIHQHIDICRAICRRFDEEVKKIRVKAFPTAGNEEYEEHQIAMKYSSADAETGSVVKITIPKGLYDGDCPMAFYYADDKEEPVALFEMIMP